MSHAVRTAATRGWSRNGARARRTSARTVGCEAGSVGCRKMRWKPRGRAGRSRCIRFNAWPDSVSVGTSVLSNRPPWPINQRETPEDSIDRTRTIQRRRWTNRPQDVSSSHPIGRRVWEVRRAPEPSLGVRDVRAPAQDALGHAEHRVAVPGLGLEPFRKGSAPDVLEHPAEPRGYVLAVDLDGPREPSKDRRRAVVPGGPEEPRRPEALEDRFHLARQVPRPCRAAGHAGRDQKHVHRLRRADEAEGQAVARAEGDGGSGP